MESDIQEILNHFAISGRLESVVPFKIGHINETYVSSWQRPQGPVRYIHQRINHHVFQNIPALMENVTRLTAHIRGKRTKDGKADPRVTLTIIPTHDGKSFILDSTGHYWRTYEFIENSISHNVCPSSDVAHEAARVCGVFLKDLADLPPQILHETIPHFHHTPNRFNVLEEAQRQDPLRRRVGAKKEVEFANARRASAGRVIEAMEQGSVPLRATHYDLKLNNVLFDTVTGKGLCVVDLDTCMPGSALYDFGDLVRSASISAAEDETDLSRVVLDESLFEAIVEGYLEGTGGILSLAEINLMAFAPKLIALELGVRFLTDYLQGDTYFRVHHPNHNLDRTRAQFKIVEDIELREKKLLEIVKKHARSVRDV